MFCQFKEVSNRKWSCVVCGKSLRTHGSKPPIAQCSGYALFQIINQPPPCPFGAIVERLTPEGLAGLDRCRRAGCRHLRPVDGRMVCDKRGSACEWLDVWAAWLNGGRGCGEWPANGGDGPCPDRPR